MSLHVQVSSPIELAKPMTYCRAGRAVFLEPRDERQLIGEAQRGNREALEGLVRAYTPLVLKHARHAARSYRADAADLTQEAMLGFVEAVRRFDPHRGVVLATYARWWIRAFVLRSVLLNWRLVRVGTTRAHRAVFFDLQRERHALTRQGRPADLAALASRLRVPEEQVADLEHHLLTAETALDAPLGVTGLTVADTLSDAEETRPDAQAADHERQEQLRKLVDGFMENLPVREREVVGRRWLSDQPAPLRDLGRALGVTGERARQLEVSLFKRFRKYAAGRLEDPGQDPLALVA